MISEQSSFGLCYRKVVGNFLQVEPGLRPVLVRQVVFRVGCEHRGGHVSQRVEDNKS